MLLTIYLPWGVKLERKKGTMGTIGVYQNKMPVQPEG